jgi:hypothetical protein
MGGKVSFSAIGEGRVKHHVGQMEGPARGAWHGGRKLALCLKFAEWAMRGHAGDGR